MNSSSLPPGTGHACFGAGSLLRLRGWYSLSQRWPTATREPPSVCPWPGNRIMLPRGPRDKERSLSRDRLRGVCGSILTYSLCNRSRSRFLITRTRPSRDCDRPVREPSVCTTLKPSTIPLPSLLAHRSCGLRIPWSKSSGITRPLVDLEPSRFAHSADKSIENRALFFRGGLLVASHVYP